MNIGSMTRMNSGIRARIRAGAAAAGLALLLGTGVAAAAAQQPATPPAASRPSAQDEFVPISELPPEEKLPAAQFVIAAYSIVWLGVTGDVWSLWRRLGRVEQELARVAHDRP